MLLRCSRLSLTYLKGVLYYFISISYVIELRVERQRAVLWRLLLENVKHGRAWGTVPKRANFIKSNSLERENSITTIAAVVTFIIIDICGILCPNHIIMLPLKRTFLFWGCAFNDVWFQWTRWRFVAANILGHCWGDLVLRVAAAFDCSDKYLLLAYWA